jgi:transposase InsO family protein
MGLEPVAAPWLDVGWATSDRLKRDLAVEALRRALVARNPAPGLLHHSDRGSQYRSVDYQALLRKRAILISLSAIAGNRLPATDERAR